MVTATKTATKQQRGLGTLLDQFNEFGKTIAKAAPASTEHAAKIVRQMTTEDSFVESLNLMIETGASFDVSVNDFKLCGAENLTSAEKHFLHANEPKILCTLQQCLLRKYLSLSDLQMFIYEVKERSAILSDGETVEPPFEVLRAITKEWFEDLLDEILKTVS